MVALIFLKILLEILVLSLFVLISLEFVISHFYLNRLTENIERERKLEIVASLKNFINQKEQEYTTMVKGYAWWSEIARAFIRNDHKYIIEEGFKGDSGLETNYNTFLVVDKNFKMIFGIFNGLTSIEDSLKIESLRNIKLERVLFQKTADAYEEMKVKFPDYKKVVFNLDSDVNNDYIWHLTEFYNGEIQKLTVTPICTNWGYPASKGFLIFGNSFNKILTQAQTIIPASFEIKDKIPENYYAYLELQQNSNGKKLYIEIKPDFLIKSIASKSINIFIAIQVLLLVLILAVILPYVNKKYYNNLTKIITEQTETLNKQKNELENKNKKLLVAMDEIKSMSGLLPICSNCHQIRDDTGYWNKLESYISDRIDVKFSHSVCPDCMKLLYPDAWKKVNEKKLKSTEEIKSKLKESFLSRSQELDGAKKRRRE